MKTWFLTGKKENNLVVLLATESDSDFYSLGIRVKRVMTECLGIIHLASFLISRGWQFELAAVTTNKADIASVCNGAVVGISTHINNYGNCLKLAAIAKSSGAKLVVLGGPHATNRAKQIISNQPNVDVVVKGQGEVSLLHLLESQITPRNIIEHHQPLDLLPDRKRGLWHDLWQADNTPNLYGKKWSLAFWSEGCPQAVCGKACIFCSIYHAKQSSQRTCEQIMSELHVLKRHNIGAIEVGDDDFPGVLSLDATTWLANKVANQNLDFDLFIHARAASIKSLEHLYELQRFGVSILQVGFESGSAKMKTAASDKATLALEDRLIDWCLETGVKIQATFMVGMPGESEKSMWQTINRAKMLAEKGVLWSLMMDPLIPLPGSQVFELLCQKYLEFAVEDHIWPEKYITAWLDNFTGVKLENFLNVREQLFASISLEANAGMLLK